MLLKMDSSFIFFNIKEIKDTNIFQKETNKLFKGDQSVITSTVPITGYRHMIKTDGIACSSQCISYCVYI